MSDNHSRVLHSFGDRLAIEQAVKALGRTTNAYQQEKLAKELAAKGKPALNALLRHLDASNPTLRGGLGRLATFLPQKEVIPALRRAAMDQSRTDAARLTAVMILERYLEQEIDPAMAQRMPASYDVARESGEEALLIAETEPLVLVEYAEQLLDEPPEIVEAVLHVIVAMENPNRARLLLAIAAYGDEALQKDIIRILGSIRHPVALQALQTLWRLSSPQQHPLIRRQVQKLTMAGVRLAEAENLRALWSPVNAQGHSFLWFIRPHLKKDGQGDALILILHQDLGIIYASAYPDFDLNALPLPAPRGKTHSAHMIDSHHQLRMVEMAPTLGLRLLDDALQTMRDQNFPWPGEIVVFGHWLWRESPLPDPAPWPALPKPAEAIDETTAQDLLEHPAFAAWVWEMPEINPLLSGQTENTLSKNSELHKKTIEALLNEDNGPMLAQRLLQQARWFTLSKDRIHAAQALAVREAVLAHETQHPFIRALAWRSILTAAADRAMRSALGLVS
ncbi:MAG: hypothetical protein DSY55_03385 [Clostridia bacterium]|nr:MAG: hypothetical protein DSY55_03385 [Clostridia bacterium]